MKRNYSFVLFVSIFLTIFSINLASAQTPEIVDLPPNLTTAYNVPFDETFELYDPEANPITGIVAVDENEDPIGTVTFTPGSWTFDWYFGPPCSWVTDGLTHTVTFYVEDEVHGQVYPNAPHYTTTLIVTEADPPEISGPCNMTTTSCALHFVQKEFEVTNREGEQIWWSVIPDITPEGYFEIVDGVFYFTPCFTDEEVGGFNFTISAMDCSGNESHCNMIAYICSCDFYHDPNLDRTYDILDIVFVINFLYKGGPAPQIMSYADWNLDHVVDILDVVYMINFLYKHGPFAVHEPMDCTSGH